MKANELMIGDWVHMKAHKGFEAQNIKVEGIPDASSDTHYGHIGAYPISEDMDYRDIEDTRLEPIPITEDFLKKNFEKKTFYGIFDDYFDLDIREYSDGLYIVTYHSCEFNIPDQAIYISWVHELQHFLNHCGITHEIKL